MTLSINTIFDSVVNTVDIYKVQVMTTSPQIKAVKQCIYDAIMDGHYSRFPSCSSDRGVFIASSAPVEVSFDGEIHLEENIKGTVVSLVIKPVFTGNGSVEWLCSGKPEKYMPTSCSITH